MTIRSGAALLVLLPTLAWAQATAQSNPPAKETKASNPDKVICRSEPTIGSLVASNKTCKTKREWDEERQSAQARVGECVNSGSATGSRC